MKDSIGGGMQLSSYFGLDVLTKEELENAVCIVADEVMEEDSVENISSYKNSAYDISERVCILEFVEEIDSIPVEDYIINHYTQKKKEVDDEEYQLYLKLKEKFEQ